MQTVIAASANPKDISWPSGCGIRLRGVEGDGIGGYPEVDEEVVE